jgi:peroxiredoxin
MRIAITLTLLAALAFADLPKALQGDVIPNFSLPTLDNKLDNRFSRDKLKEAVKKSGAKRVVLSFFDSTCKICMTEFKLLEDNKSQLDANGVQVYLVSVGESVHEKGDIVKAFVDKYAGGLFPFYFDPNVTMFKNFGLGDRKGYALPVVVVLDANLKALKVLRGEIDNFPQILWSEL